MLIASPLIRTVRISWLTVRIIGALPLDKEPEVIYSPLCARFPKDATVVEVSIFRIGTETTWHLEVINEQNTSTVWDDPFDTDHAAWAEFLSTVEDQGMVAFEDVPTVVH